MCIYLQSDVANNENQKAPGEFSFDKSFAIC